MGYSVKWVMENLGITRDMLRYYEEKKLLPANPDRQYRNYSDKDIERIWGIKLLIELKFSAGEIYALMNDPKFDFDATIAQKIAELQRDYDKSGLYLEFAKSVKLMGRVPSTSRIGSIRFDDFLAYSLEKWNFYNDSQSSLFMNMADTIVLKEPKEWNPDDMERILGMLKASDIEQMMHTYALHGYYQVISDMRDVGYNSDTVQRVVRLLHQYMINHNTEPELEGKITPQFIAKYMVPFFLDGDIAKQHERNYGKEGCIFIAKAIAYYGKNDMDNL